MGLTCVVVMDCPPAPPGLEGAGGRASSESSGGASAAGASSSGPPGGGDPALGLPPTAGRLAPQPPSPAFDPPMV